MCNNPRDTLYGLHQIDLNPVNNVVDGLNWRVWRKAAVIVHKQPFFCGPYPDVVKITQ